MKKMRFDVSERIFFSQDANFIIASGKGHLSLWGIESKDRLILIRCVSVIFQSLRWDARKPEYIFKEHGRYFTGSMFDWTFDKSRRIGYYYDYWPATENMPLDPHFGLYAPNGGKELETGWNGKPLLGFPSSYFPSHWHDIRMLWIRGKRIAMGYKSGHVMLLNFEGR